MIVSPVDLRLSTIARERKEKEKAKKIKHDQKNKEEPMEKGESQCSEMIFCVSRANSLLSGLQLTIPAHLITQTY